MRGDRKSLNKVKKGRLTPITYEDCRAPNNHWWESSEATKLPRNGGFYLIMRCTKCGTERVQITDRYGNVEKNSGQYKYPEGYRDTDGWTRSQWRINWLMKNYNE